MNEPNIITSLQHQVEAAWSAEHRVPTDLTRASRELIGEMDIDGKANVPELVAHLRRVEAEARLPGRDLPKSIRFRSLTLTDNLLVGVGWPLDRLDELELHIDGCHIEAKDGVLWVTPRTDR